MQDLSLDIAPGELVALLGPSGCGKTTLLKIIAGFERQTTGQVAIDGAALDDVPPHRRRVGIVFQSYALFPHLTVAQNVAYGLQGARHRTRRHARPAVAEMLALVQIATLADRRPGQLSGGQQQQRVAIARALAVEPAILLLDEPFAALDRGLRLDMQIEIRRIQRLAGITTILVTHDQEEALSMADRVAVLQQGRLEQFAPPTEIYDAPASLFVNTFVGTANVLPGTVLSVEAGQAVIQLAAGPRIVAATPAALQVGAPTAVCLRPEGLALSTEGEGIDAVVEIGLPLGASIVHELRTIDGAVLKVTATRSAGATPLPPGTTVKLSQIPQVQARAFPL